MPGLSFPASAHLHAMPCPATSGTIRDGECAKGGILWYNPRGGTGEGILWHRPDWSCSDIGDAMSKVIPMEEAIRLVASGSTLGLGGMTLYRRPVAFVRALLDTGVADLTLISLTCGFESDLLVGAGRVRRLRTCYFGLEAFGLAPMFTQRATAGEVEIIEETEASLAFGLRATLAGVGFLPSPAWLGTDLPRVRPDVKTVQDPYSGREYTAFPALSADVMVIHAPVADRSGNAQAYGNLALDRELGLVADRVIITAEKVVDRLAGPLELAGVGVDYVVEAPDGAWPTSCYPDYPLDGDELLDYVEACGSGQFDAYLERFLARSAGEKRVARRGGLARSRA
jgi:glutaconate CoA-transferase subunit A